VRLLLVYPRAWRERYGDELAVLLEAEPLSWRTRLDVVRGGLAQRFGCNDASPVLSGVLLVLCAWSVFVVGGVIFQKTSEHWQAAMPHADRALPAAAFDAVVGAALVGSTCVLLGVLLTAVPLYRFVRAGGRLPIHGAVAAGVATVGAAVPLAVWAHRLSDAQRNGGDWHYGVAASLFFLCAVTALAAWTRAAVVTARRLTLPPALLRLETLLAVVVTVTMVAMSAATAAWWSAVGTGLEPNLLLATALMLVATALGAAGTVRSLRA
jgi:hypothetical protein